MVEQLASIRNDAVLLRDDSPGVHTEDRNRKIQEGSSYLTTLNSYHAQQIGIDEQGTLVLHSVSTGVNPVIVQNPAIIVQPATAIQNTTQRGGYND